MILGSVCTRSCAFCAVKKSVPGTLDLDEPAKILGVVNRLGLQYVIITSVTRDDLEDGGAGQFVKVIGTIKNFSKNLKIEVLAPDFNGNKTSIHDVVKTQPAVFGHNIETAKRLYPFVRKDSDYNRSIDLLRFVKKANPLQITKSSIMVGLGETDDEVIETMRDLRKTHCDLLTIGQYLRPRLDNLPVSRFLRLEEFERYRKIGSDLGFKNVSAGPFVRSSYCAEDGYLASCC